MSTWQGIKWLRKREEDNGLSVIQLSQKRWLRDVETAIMNGQTLIIENIGEEIDPTLDPVLARAIYKKGRYVSTKLTPYTCSHNNMGGTHASRVSDEEYSLT